MDPLTTASLGLGALSSISGMLGGAARARAARRARQAALADYLRGLDAEVQGINQSGQRALWKATGLAGDQLAALGGRMGSGLAQAGVFNSSATAGALAAAQDASAQALGELAFGIDQSARAARARGLQWAAGQQMGWADQDLAAAQASQGAGYAGLGNLFGQLQSVYGGGAKAPAQASAGAPAAQAPGVVQSPELANVSFGAGLGQMPRPAQVSLAEQPSRMRQYIGLESPTTSIGQGMLAGVGNYGWQVPQFQTTVNRRGYGVPKIGMASR